MVLEQHSIKFLYLNYQKKTLVFQQYR